MITLLALMPLASPAPIAFNVGMIPCSREQVVQYFEEGFRSQEKFERVWSDLEVTLPHLRMDGGEVPSLEAVRAVMADFLTKPDEMNPMIVSEKGGLNPLILKPMVQFGVVPDDYVGEKSLADYERMLFKFTSRHIGSFSGLVVPLESVMRARELEPDEVDYLARRLFEELPEGSDHGVLEEILDAIWILERIGRAEEVERLAPLVESALLATWTGRREAGACFAPSADLVGEPSDPLTSVWLDSTSRAVELMGRFAVPDEIDLEALGLYLAHERLYYEASEPNSWDLTAAAALSHLETFPGWVPIELPTEPGPIDILQRFTWLGAGALAMLVVMGMLIFVATRRSPAAQNTDWSSGEPK